VPTRLCPTVLMELAARKQDKDERDEQESLLDLYLRAMESAGSSQAKAA
jgi:GapR-like nucleoid associated protein